MLIGFIVSCSGTTATQIDSTPSFNLPPIPSAHPKEPAEYINPLYHSFYGRYCEPELSKDYHAWSYGSCVDKGGYVFYKLDVPENSYAINIIKNAPAWICLPDFETGLWTFQYDAGYSDFYIEDAWKYIYNNKLWIAVVFWDSDGYLEFIDAYYSRISTDLYSENYKTLNTYNLGTYVCNDNLIINDTYPPTENWHVQQLPSNVVGVWTQEELNNVYSVYFTESNGEIHTTIGESLRGSSEQTLYEQSQFVQGELLGTFDIPRRVGVVVWDQDLGSLFVYYCDFFLYDNIPYFMWEYEGENLRVQIDTHKPENISIYGEGDTKYILYNGFNGPKLFSGSGADLYWGEESLPNGFSYNKAVLVTVVVGLGIVYENNGSLFYTIRNLGEDWTEPTEMMGDVKEWDIYHINYYATRFIWTDHNDVLYYMAGGYNLTFKGQFPMVVDYNAKDIKYWRIGTNESFTGIIKCVSYVHDNKLLLAQLQGW